MTHTAGTVRIGERLDLYSRTAHSASARVLSGYSTSFGMATKLLPQPNRRMIRGVYALVRVADEIVDGTASDAGFTSAQCQRELDTLETETLTAMETGFSTNMVVHAFAEIARQTSIEHELVRAFFRSMRLDLEPSFTLTDAQYRSYVYGSAEVVGLMCLRTFLWCQPQPESAADQLEAAAQRLGAAFQKINFLRDLADDQGRLARTYIPGTGPDEFDQQRKMEILEEIDADLQHAHAGISLLPPGPRRATAVAAALFAELNNRLRGASISELRQSRISVPAAVKVRVIGASLMQTRCKQ